MRPSRACGRGEGAHDTSGTIGKPDQFLLMFSKRSPSESLIA
jgi:hypothetical protein